MSGFVYTQYPVVGTHWHSPAYKLFYTGIIEVVLFSWCVKNIVVCESLVLSKDDLRLVRCTECAHSTHINLLPCILRTYPKWVFECVWVCECVYECVCFSVWVWMCACTCTHKAELQLCILWPTHPIWDTPPHTGQISSKVSPTGPRLFNYQITGGPNFQRYTYMCVKTTLLNHVMHSDISIEKSNIVLLTCNKKNPQGGIMLV